MSVYAIEKALWDVCNDPASLALYRSNPVDFAARYALTGEEQRMLRGLRVRALTRYKVNPMLVMMTWNAVVGADKIGEYLGTLNAPAPAGAEDA
ncbi:MAG: hypothetical protein WCH32_18400 [Pseudomonadota bacterium]